MSESEEAFLRSRRHFLRNACHVCKDGGTSVECGVCHMVFYCCAQHRRQDWQTHSHLCRALYKLTQMLGCSRVYEKAAGVSVQQWEEFKHSTARQCTALLGRALEPCEYEVLYYPRVCATCYESDPTQLTPCQDCGYVYTCREEHISKDHKRWCTTLKSYCDVIVLQHKHGGYRLPVFRVLNSILSNADIPFSMADLLDRYSSTVYNGSTVSEPDTLRRVMLSELATYPLTLATHLRQICSSSSSSSKVLTVHLIGAEMQAEVEPLGKWETFLLHLLPDDTQVLLVFIGPELRLPPGVPVAGPLDVCSHCRSHGKSISFELKCGKFYHQVNQLKEPDMACAFNSGMYRRFGFGSEDSWKATIPLLFSENCFPVLITEYTEWELNRDMECLPSDVTVLAPPTLNQFASEKPGLNIISEQDCPVIFKNYFYCLVKGSSM